MQQVLIMLTEHPDMRSQVTAWTCEDSREYVPGKHIGLSGGPKFRYTYKTVLEALADRWKLLAPPSMVEEIGGEYFEWWFTRESNETV